MPIPYSQTKPGRAGTLLRRLAAGPSFYAIGPGARDRMLTPEQAQAQYRLWAASWITPEVLALLPPKLAAVVTERSKSQA